MSLFKKIFGPKSPTHKEVTNFELLSNNGGGFFYWNGELYHSDIVRGAIRPKANAISKLTTKHIKDNDKFLVNPEPNIRLILEEPNPFMSMQDYCLKWQYSEN